MDVVRTAFTFTFTFPRVSFINIYQLYVLGTLVCLHLTTVNSCICSKTHCSTHSCKKMTIFITKTWNIRAFCSENHPHFEVHSLPVLKFYNRAVAIVINDLDDVTKPESTKSCRQRQSHFIVLTIFKFVNKSCLGLIISPVWYENQTMSGWWNFNFNTINLNWGQKSKTKQNKNKTKNVLMMTKNMEQMTYFCWKFDSQHPDAETCQYTNTD